MFVDMYGMAHCVVMYCMAHCVVTCLIFFISHYIHMCIYTLTCVTCTYNKHISHYIYMYIYTLTCVTCLIQAEALLKLKNESYR